MTQAIAVRIVEYGARIGIRTSAAWRSARALKQGDSPVKTAANANAHRNTTPDPSCPPVARAVCLTILRRNSPIRLPRLTPPVTMKGRALFLGTFWASEGSTPPAGCREDLSGRELRHG